METVCPIIRVVRMSIFVWSWFWSSLFSCDSCSCCDEF